MRNQRVLVVDDDPDITEYFSSLLEDHGYDVDAAGSTASALELLGASVPDVILIDVMMPGRSGLDLLVTLRRNKNWSAIPVVVITGNDHILRDDCQSYLGSHDGVRGPDGVLGKPVDRSALLNILEVLCERGPVLDA